MSRAESPFHVIAAQALDETTAIKANGSSSLNACPSRSAMAAPEVQGVEQEQVGAKEVAEKSGFSEVEAEGEQRGSLGVSPVGGGAELVDTVTKKSKKRTNMWKKTTSRKSAKKGSIKNAGGRPSDGKDDNVLLKPFHSEDDPSYPILLSKTHKAEKIELSVDRLAASGSKGYRMVKATRGIVEGAWYFEITLEKLGSTGHTRLGWSTRKGDIQAPVGYDNHSYSYRDVDGSKVHAALREDYGEEYHEKDVIGFYIHLPREAGFARRAEEEIVEYKGQPYTIVADEALKPVPGSEILFFKNGECQGPAFKDIYDGAYFPAASMYTHPRQDCCKVLFNFGPDFKYPPSGLGDRPSPLPMCQASDPGEGTAAVVLAMETKGVADSTQSTSSKQQVTAVCATADDSEEANAATIVENPAKEHEKVSLVKKKVKFPKIRLDRNIPSPMPKRLKVPGKSRLHAELQKEARVNVVQRDSNGAGPASIDLTCQNGTQEERLGTGHSIVKKILEASNKEKLWAKLKPRKADFSGADLENRKGTAGLQGLEKSRKDSIRQALPASEGSKKGAAGAAELPNQKEKGWTGVKRSTANAVGPRLTSFTGSKMDVIAGPGSQNVYEGKRPLGSPRRLIGVTGTKKASSLSGFPSPKRPKKDVSVAALNRSKGSIRPITAPMQNREELPRGAASVLKPSRKGASRARPLPGETRPSTIRGMKNWGAAFPGAVNVDVVVVESSTRPG